MRRSLASVPRHACTANTGRSSCCSGSASPRSSTAGAPPISARPLLPEVIQSPPPVRICRYTEGSVVLLVFVYPPPMEVMAPQVARGSDRGGLPPDAVHPSVLIAPIDRLWRGTPDRPLKLFAG